MGFGVGEALGGEVWEGDEDAEGEEGEDLEEGFLHESRVGEKSGTRRWQRTRRAQRRGELGGEMKRRRGVRGEGGRVANAKRRPDCA